MGFDVLRPHHPLDTALELGKDVLEPRVLELFLRDFLLAIL